MAMEFFSKIVPKVKAEDEEAEEEEQELVDPQHTLRVRRNTKYTLNTLKTTPWTLELLLRRLYILRYDNLTDQRVGRNITLFFLRVTPIELISYN